VLPARGATSVEQLLRGQARPPRDSLLREVSPSDVSRREIIVSAPGGDSPGDGERDIGAIRERIGNGVRHMQTEAESKGLRTTSDGLQDRVHRTRAARTVDQPDRCQRALRRRPLA
jgi:sirohydrochlorin ferrochelatase